MTVTTPGSSAATTSAPPDLTGTGTPEAQWRAAGIPTRLPPLDPAELLASAPSGRVLLVAPHPDDEVLGAGLTLAALSAVGAQLHIVAVTDGGASRGGDPTTLPAIRAAERDRALAQLGLAGTAVHRLGHPDGAVDAGRLATQLGALIRSGDVVLAPWHQDGHPDHDAAGVAAAVAATDRGARLWSYLVWTWHWAEPGLLAGLKARRVTPPAALATRLAAAKRSAVACFTSQLSGTDPVLPAQVLARLTRDSEVLLDGAG